MADRLRAVTLDVGGRPTVLLDLNDMANLFVVADSFSVTPGQKSQISAASDRRYGGSRQVGETNENAVVAWTILVKGSTPVECTSRVEQVLAVLERMPGFLLEWRPEGHSVSTFLEPRATATWRPTLRWAQLLGAASMAVEVSWPVAPLARGLPMDIVDQFTADTRGDYGYDAGSSAGEQWTGGALVGVGTLTSERRAVHTARGYSSVSPCVQIQATPGATVTGFKAGVVIKRMSATTYIEAYVTDDGSHSVLGLSKVAGGVRTALAATVTLPARMTTGSSVWVRGRIDDTAVVAEVFTSAPGAMTTPQASVSATLAGTDLITFAGAGLTGRVWVPQDAAATIREWRSTPFWLARTLPELLSWQTPIPGTAPALADVTITHSGGTAPPAFAVLGWAGRATAGLARPPFGVLEAEDAGNLSGWAGASDATGRGGAILADASSSSSKTYTAAWLVDPATLAPDAFDHELAVEVWARVGLASTIVAPTMTLSVRPEDGVAYGAEGYSEEWGTAGRPLTPTTAAKAWRLTRLGTLRLAVDPLRPRRWLLWIAAQLGAGSSGFLGLDYVVLVPARQRACSPSGVPRDGSYPAFLASTAQVAKTLRADLSAVTAQPPKHGHPDHGLGGELLELPPGNVDLAAKLSSLVPDDPTVDASTEQLSHSCVVQMSVTPRWLLVRSA